MAKAGFNSMIVQQDWNANPSAVIQRAAELGFAGLEIAIPESLCEALTLYEELSTRSMKAITGHIAFDDLISRFGHIVSMARFLRLDYLTISWSPFDSLDYIGKAVDWCAGFGGKLKDEGLQLLYHNHDHELKLFGGRVGLDLLFERTSPECLQAHPDTYWLKRGGQDPEQWLKRMAGRCPVLHLKDMAEDGSICELGGGTLDLAGITRQAESGGTQWITYEQDEPYKLSPWQSVEASAGVMKKLGLL